MESKFIHDPVLSKLEKLENIGYRGKIQWMGQTIDLRFNVPEDPDEQEKRIEKVLRMVQEQERWNKMLLEIVIKYLLDLANDWNVDMITDEDPDIDLDEIPDITEEEFCERIELESINIDSEGELEAWYADGDLFLGHSIKVEGSLVDEEMYVAYMS